MNTITVDDKQLAVNAMVQNMKEIDPDGNHAGLISSKEALRYAADHSVDIAFLDIEMPEMNGLEMAAELKKLRPDINIVFVTGHVEYALDAHAVFASGYLVKPADVSDVRKVLDNLRNPVSGKNKMKVRCFGNFEVFANNRPILFRRAKCKEILAYLIDCRGASVTMGELISILWEDGGNLASRNSQLRTFISDLRKSLADAGFEDILIREYNSLAVKTDKLDCDFYNFMERDPDAVREFLGEYMRQYSWAEERIAELMEIKQEGGSNG
ncbi:MAG: response regulator [Lachnospiraceae bacterium]|nr:response regulator [Lachnospiraceae bacterium]